MRRLLALPLLLVGLVAAACGTTTAPAAEVNGSAISDSDFRDELAVLAEHPSFAGAFLGVDPGGDGESNVTSAFAAQVLTIEVILELVDTEVAERGLAVTADDLDETRAGLGPDFATLLDELPEDYQDGFLEWNAQIAVLRDDLGGDIGEITDADVQAFYDENEEQFRQSCLSHVLVETQEQAEEILAEIEGGLDFADAAAQYSIDPSAAENGGDLGCNAPGTFVPGFEEAAFAEAPIGEPYGPVESQFGFHLLLVRERSELAFDEVAEQIRTQLETQAAAGPQQALATWIDEAVASADVSVSSRYGSWDEAQGTVVAPEGPSSVANLLQL